MEIKISRNSKKRKAISDLFLKGDLLEASEICEKLPEIDPATVYRNLKKFVDEGVLREVRVRKGISSYELNVPGDDHQHFICDTCEKVLPVEVSKDDLKKALPKDVEFEGFELNLVGKCEDCK